MTKPLGSMGWETGYVQFCLEILGSGQNCGTSEYYLIQPYIHDHIRHPVCTQTSCMSHWASNSINDTSIRLCFFLPDVPDMLVAVPHCGAVEIPEVPRVDQGVVGDNHVAVGEGKFGNQCLKQLKPHKQLSFKVNKTWRITWWCVTMYNLYRGGN